MKKQQPTSRTFQVPLVLLASVFCGCAGGWALANPAMAQKSQGRVVEAVELNDGQVIYFDPFDSAGPGPDTRARLSGETIEGTVAGAPRAIYLQDVKKVRFGIEEKEAFPYMIGAAVTVALLVSLLILFTLK